MNGAGEPSAWALLLADRHLAYVVAAYGLGFAVIAGLALRAWLSLRVWAKRARAVQEGRE